MLFLFSVGVYAEISDDKIRLKDGLLKSSQNGKESIKEYIRQNPSDLWKTILPELAKNAMENRNENLISLAIISAQEYGNDTVTAEVIFTSGDYYFYISDFKNAFKQYEKTLTLYKKLNRMVGQGNVYLKYGDIFLKYSDKENALKMYELGLPFYEKANDLLGQGNIYLGRGEIYLYTEDIDSASQMYEKALPFFEKADEPIGQGNIYFRRGDIFLKINANDTALKMYEKALPFFEKAQDSLGQGNVYFSIGDIFFRAGENDTALKMYKKALRFFENAQDILGQGNVYRCIGDVYAVSGNTEQALKMYDNALPFFIKAEALLGLGNIYRSQGDIYFNRGANDTALKMYEKALPFFEKVQDSLGQGNIYFRRGDIFFRIGDDTNALIMYEKSITFFEKIRDNISQGNVYFRRGDIFLRTGNNEQALKMYKNAQCFFERANEPQGQGNIYQRQGEIYFRTGANDTAQKMYMIALPFFEKANEPIGQGNVYMCLGNLYFYTGSNDSALKMYMTALPFFEKVQEPLGQGNVYQSLGDLYFYTNENETALKMFEKALPFFEKTQVLLGQGNIYFKQGDIYFMTGDDTNALKIYAKALPFFEKINEPLGQGNVYFRRGAIFFRTGNNEQALKMFEKALSFFGKIQDPRGQGNVYLKQGEIYFSTGDNKQALKMYGKALLFYKKAGDLFGQSNVYFRQGDLYLQTGDNEQALKMYDKAINLENKCNSLENQAYSLFKKAKTLNAMSAEPNKSAVLIEQGLSLFETIRRKTGISDLKTSFMEKVFNQYEDACQFMFKNNFTDSAFYYLESMKARVFIDMLAERKVDLNKGINPELKKKRDDIENRYSFLNKKLQEILKNKSDTSPEYIEKYEKMNDTLKELEDIKTKIRINNPMYALVEYPKPVTRAELQKNILRDSEVILEYMLAKDTAYILIITKDNFSFIPLSVKPDKIINYTEELLNSAKPYKENKTYKIKRFNDDYAEYLYNILINPAADKIKDKDVIIIGDGILNVLPFEMLKNKNGNYFIETNKIKYIQSATVLSFLRTQNKIGGATDRYVCFGDPVYDYEHFIKGETEVGAAIRDEGQSVEITDDYNITRREYQRAGGVLNRLEGTGEEVKKIAELFKEKNQQTILNIRKDATEENAKEKNMKNFGYIHFATHGIFSADMQALALSQIPDAKEDGFFTLGEIMNSDYNAKLIVLSACKTGLGKDKRGEGVVGLTRAFMYAGAPAVCPALWSVDDKRTKDFMIEFYDNILNKKMSKADALRQVKLDFINLTDFKHPYFWAAFVLYGE